MSVTSATSSFAYSLPELPDTLDAVAVGQPVAPSLQDGQDEQDGTSSPSSLFAPTAATTSAAASATTGSTPVGPPFDAADQITFTSREQAETILGVSLPENLATLTFRVVRNGDTSVDWLPVTLKRSGIGSITNPDANKTNAYAAGDVITLTGALDTPRAFPFTENEFLAMHSEEQRAAMLLYGRYQNGRLVLEMPWSDATNPATGIRYDVDPDFVPSVTAMMDDAGTRVIIADRLDSRTITKLSAAEQEDLGALVLFQRRRLAELGLSTVIPTELQDAIDAILAVAVPSGTTLTSFTAEYQQLFLDQLDLLSAQLDAQRLYSGQAIQDRVSALMTRFRTAYAYGSVNAESSSSYNSRNPDDSSYGDPQSQRVNNVISLDSGAAVQAGFEAFLEQERRLLELLRQSLNMRSNHAGNRALDALTLAFKFMLIYNLRTESLITVKTEEIKQQNELLKTYAAMQALVSDAAMNKKDLAGSDGDRDTGGGQSNFLDVTPRSKNPIVMGSMFDENDWLYIYGGDKGTYQQQAHPLETLRNITRPTTRLFSDDNTRSDGKTRGRFVKHEASGWTAYGTQLSDAVTLINQETQVDMNAVSTMEKEKNRFFEMGNNALSRLVELYQSIARAL